ncbi:uncharacterized protein SPPG_09466 [Spizellomyces punctatus DAOM BR117]|uniref:Vezatin n=1 Tax=Spizellomyces punctatus (strain DAOM BR117) TaxID=645134 RepID=A0A0L0H8D9_SPIPD|nr:uncharacterized protein SPPG_09466 [Spizellomyces punctatus DAOM BR117]KNC97482.1 hypothetical protein SPPG_09466 [Spizellomyces punctatus DAOM BR117]|eukprot:XP_016605522.1 hypothetical protein SPPG_09466 [Spizellomyces punctatus DAOM BR117]
MAQTGSVEESIVYEDTPLGNYLEWVENEGGGAAVLEANSPADAWETGQPAQTRRWAQELWVSFKSLHLPRRLFPSLESRNAVFETLYKEEVYEFLLLQHHSVDGRLASSSNSRAMMPNSISAEFGALLGLWVLGGASAWAGAAILARQRGGAHLAGAALLVMLSVPLVWATRSQWARTRLGLLHRSCLSTLRSFLQSSHELDKILRKAIRYVQEVELVSRGYRLAPALSPITRIEQSSKSKRCIALRTMIRHVIDDILSRSRSSQASLALLSGSADHASSPTPSVPTFVTDDSDSLSLCSLKYNWQLMRLQRVELLNAVLVVAPFDQVPDVGYCGQRWTKINGHLDRVTETLRASCLRISQCIETELRIRSDEIAADAEDTHAVGAVVNRQRHRQRKYLASAISLDQRLKEIRTKLLICTQDIENMDDELQLDPIAQLFDSIGRDLENASCNWKEAQYNLQHLFADSGSNNDDDMQMATDLKTGRAAWDEQIYKERIAVHDSIPDENLQQEGPEELYEDTAEDISDIAPASNKLTREQRIQLQQAKRQVKNHVKVQRIAKDEMMSELKNVLTQRKPHVQTS